MHHLLTDHIERAAVRRWDVANLIEADVTMAVNPWKSVLDFLDGMQEITYKVDGIDSESMSILKDLWTLALYRMANWRT